MNRFSIFKCLFFFASIPLTGQTDCDPVSMHCWEKVFIAGGILNCTDYTISLDEQFNNLQEWDTYYFSENYNYARAHHPCEEQLFFDQNVIIDNNRCIIRGKHEPNSTWTNAAGTTFTRDFTSGVIMAKDGYHFGRFEATVDDMPGKGWWPAFWMWHHEEIDIMERFYDEFEYSFNVYPSNKCNITTRVTTSTSLYSGPHTFGMEFTPFKVTGFYNGQALPNVVYRYINLDGTPLDVDCNQPIPEGIYYLNPNFPLLWRYFEDGNLLESTTFRPILGMAVLPKRGLQCCGDNLYCDDPGCNLNCSNWGHPVDDNGVEIPGYEANTGMIISNVKVEERIYRTCNAIAVKHKDIYCVNDDITVIVESFSNLNQFSLHQVQINDVSTSPNLSFINTVRHEVHLKALSAGPASFTIDYLDDCGVQRSVTRQINISNSGDCNLDVCDDTHQYECCPENTHYDGANCFYGTAPGGYIPIIKNNAFYVTPNCLISANNNCCPPGYVFDGQDCHSGISFPSKHQGFVYNNRFYVRPECGDIRDCCPPGYKYDGANCFSFVSAPDEYQAFIYENAFYVHPNCQISIANNCCPAGFTFDGANCHSGVYIPEGYEGFIFENSFYVKPFCEDESDCCPVGTHYDGANCWYAKIPAGYEGFAYRNRFYVKPDCTISTENSCCPAGYTFDGANCASEITFSNPYQGFAYEGGFYVDKHCPQDESCCPQVANYDGANCWYLNIPHGYQPFILDNAFYVVPNCLVSVQNNCCPEGFVFDGANCHSGIFFPPDLNAFIFEGSFYSSSFCEDSTDGYTGVDIRDSGIRQFVPNRITPDVFRIFPNPAQHYINIGIQEELTGTSVIRIMDNLSRIVDEITLKDIHRESTLTISLDHLYPGIYQLNIENGQYRAGGHFIKQ